MKLALMALGGILIAFGLVDIIGSYNEFDLWGEFIGIQLPEILWNYSAYIELIIGYLVFKVGSNMGDEEPVTEE